MAIFKQSLLGLATVLALSLHAVPAQATALRTFVSSTGNDANTASNCSATAPCRTLTAAFSVTQAHGHIVIVDSGGYGTLTITRSVTILGTNGALIGVPAGSNGITINAGPNDTIKLKGLVIDGANVGDKGIKFNTGLSLIIEDCIIHRLAFRGIEFTPNATSNLLISNTLVADNPSDGIHIEPTGSGRVTAVLNRVEVINNQAHGVSVIGINSTGTIDVTASHSIAARNAGTGFAVASSTAQATLSLFQCVAAHNFGSASGVGISSSGANAGMRIAQSTIIGNNVAGWNVAGGGTIATYQDNYINQNGPNVGNLTPIGRQ